MNKNLKFILIMLVIAVGFILNTRFALAQNDPRSDSGHYYHSPSDVGGHTSAESCWGFVWQPGFQPDGILPDNAQCYRVQMLPRGPGGIFGQSCEVNTDLSVGPYPNKCIEAATEQDSSLRLITLSVSDWVSRCGQNADCATEFTNCINKYKLGPSDYYNGDRIYDCEGESKRKYPNPNGPGSPSQSGPTCSISFDSERNNYVLRGNSLPVGKVVIERFETPGGRKAEADKTIDSSGLFSYTFNPTSGISKTTLTVYPDVSIDQPVPKLLCSATYNFTAPNASPTPGRGTVSPTPEIGGNPTPTQSPTLTPTPTLPPKPADVKVFIISDDGDSNKPNQSFYPGEKIKVYARLFSSDEEINKQFNNLDGCVPTSENNPLYFTVTNDTGSKTLTTFQNLACQAQEFTMPNTTGTYKIKVELKASESYFGASYGQLVFEVSKGGRVPTDVIAQINGYETATLYELPQDGDIQLTGFVFEEGRKGDPENDCLITRVHLEWVKTKEDGKDIERVLKEDDPINCTPIEAKIDGYGTYKLRAQYINLGNDKYINSEQSEATLVIVKPKQALTLTTTAISIAPEDLVANAPSGNGKVAGIAVKRVGDHLEIVTQASSDDVIHVTACTTPSQITFNTLSILPIGEDGSPRDYLINGPHPNCEPTPIQGSQFSGIDHLIINASYDPQGFEPYAPSQAETLTLEVDDSQDGEEPVIAPFVTLSSNPAVISPSDFARLTIIATTNTQVSNPTFAWHHDGAPLTPKTADRSSSNCSVNAGNTCRYEADFYTLDSGDYTVQFCNNTNLCDTLRFIIGARGPEVTPTPQQPEETQPPQETQAPEPTPTDIPQVSRVTLRDEVTGAAYTLPPDGRHIDIFLAGDADEMRTHVFSLQLHYTDGTIEEKGNVSIMYEPIPVPTPTRRPTPIPTMPSDPDSDGDGTHDSQDQCDFVAGPPGNRGCPLPTPTPEEENPPPECDDVYYPDENSETGCLRKWSPNDPYPYCEYTFDPVDESFCY